MKTLIKLTLALVSLGLLGCNSAWDLSSSKGVLKLALTSEITQSADSVDIHIVYASGQEQQRSIALTEQLFVEILPGETASQLKMSFRQGSEVSWLGELTNLSPFAKGETRTQPLVVDPAGTLGIELPTPLLFNPSGSQQEVFEISQIQAIPLNAPPGTLSVYDIGLEETVNLFSLVVPAGAYRFELSGTIGTDELTLQSPPVIVTQAQTVVYKGQDLCHPLIPGIPCRQDNDDEPTLEAAIAWGEDGIYVARISQGAPNEQSIFFSYKKQSDGFRAQEQLLGSALWWGFHSISLAVHDEHAFVGYTENQGAIRLIHITPAQEPTFLTPSSTAFANLDSSCAQLTSPEHSSAIATTSDGLIQVVWQAAPTELSWLGQNEHLGPICAVTYNPFTQNWLNGQELTNSNDGLESTSLGMNPQLYSNGQNLLATWESLSAESAADSRTINVRPLIEGGAIQTITKIQKACPNGKELPYGIAYDNEENIGIVRLDCSLESQMSEVHLDYYSIDGPAINNWSQAYPGNALSSVPQDLTLRWTQSTLEGALILKNEAGFTQIQLIDLLDENGDRNGANGQEATKIKYRRFLELERSIPAIENIERLHLLKNPAAQPGSGNIAVSYIAVDQPGSITGKLYLAVTADSP